MLSRHYLLLIILFVFLASCNQNREAEMVDEIRVNNIGLYDQNDNFHNLYYYDDAKTISLFVQGNGCPIVRNGFHTYQSIAEKYQDQGHRFFMVNANMQDQRSSIKKEAEEFGMELPILVDRNQIMADNLNLERTAEVILINPRSWKILYRGPVDDQLGYEGKKEEAKDNYLVDAIESFLIEEEIERKFRNTDGCSITRKSKIQKPQEITYVEHIAPLLKEKCSDCHKPKGIAPWAMTDYNMVMGWSSMIREVLATRRMPPWHADPEYGEFEHDLSLSDEQRLMIMRWIDNGLERGEGEDILKDVNESVANWTLGEPDIVIDFAAEDIPATGILDYRYQEFDLGNTEDLPIKAVEILPGSSEVLHHIQATVRYPEDYELPVERKRGPWVDGVFAVWVPGMDPEVFPEGSVKTIPVGSEFHVQLHYTTNGKAVTDKSKIGLYFAEEGEKEEFVGLGPANFEFEIPPNARNKEVAAVENFDRDLTLYGIFPHMHFRGKSMKMTLIHPDKSEEVILNVPNYNFNWQRYYHLKEPMKVQAGSKLKVDAVFDNSPQNPFNPDPEQTIVFGEQTYDEMMIGFIQFIYDDQKELSSL